MSAKIVFALTCVVMTNYGSSQEFGLRQFYGASRAPLPFPTCRAIDVDCQRRGLRTFFFLMDAGHLGMRPIDPTLVNSVTVAHVEQQVTLRMSRLNVTGARWTRLVDRRIPSSDPDLVSMGPMGRFNLQGNRSGVRFQNDFHITGLVQLKLAERFDPLTAFITMDIVDVESNITYKWEGQRGIDNEDYILIGQERVAVRNLRIPTYYLISDNQDAYMINEAIRSRPTLIDEISNEIVASVMHNIIDNFRLLEFAYNVPVKYYYQYY